MNVREEKPPKHPFSVAGLKLSLFTILLEEFLEWKWFYRRE